MKLELLIDDMTRQEIDSRSDPAKQQQTLRYFEAVFRSAASTFRGYIDRQLRVR